jgi:selenocysteine-specific elongation factor
MSNTSAATDTANNDNTNDEEVLNVNVGILGHVDSGKTSLVKTLSTLLSTAALDKSKQSRQRGMTLDLGFSCFYLEMPPHLKQAFSSHTKLQITLVDCPGHSSLIRTIIGGAQIIDMVLLVVDAYKGWQAQTTECLVLAELTSPHLVVALNKVDLFPADEREERLAAVKRDIQARLQNTRFANAPLVGVSACVGGEKVAAVGEASESTTTTTTSNQNQETYNMNQLVQVLQDELPPPKRTDSGLFYFSIDHCFPIRGQGTVLTGTVLNGNVSVNSMIEFPTLGLERKVKSMQMFRRKVQKISQGDRAGICVSNFDSKLLERGVAAAPGAVQLLKGAIALVRKVSYFPGKLAGGNKFHISVGHSTVMATVTFWGARELMATTMESNAVENEEQQDQQEDGTVKTGNKKAKNPTLRGHTSLGGEAEMAGLPRLSFDFDQDFLQQDELIETLDGKKDSYLHWALLEFHTPVFCPLDSLVIGSRLDAVDSGSSSSCRLAFSGRLVEKLSDPPRDATRVRLYAPKEKRGVISRLGDPHRRDDDQKVVRYEVFGSDLFKKETNMKPFVGMKLITEKGEIGEIKSSFGTSGKFRVLFPAGTEAREGDALILKFKRYAHDPQKAMHQDMELPKARMGSRMEIVKKKEKKATVVATGEVVTLKGEPNADNKYEMAIIAGFFTPEVNVREKVGSKVRIPSTEEEGKIAGPFGKAGKCKVSFESGLSAQVGAKAELLS